MAFQVRSDRKESETKTIRFPLPLLERIEEAIREKDCTFSGFIIQACEYVLNELDSAEERKRDTDGDSRI